MARALLALFTIIMVGCAVAVVERPANTIAYRAGIPADVPLLTPVVGMCTDDAAPTKGLIEATLDTIGSEAFASALLRTKDFLGPLWLGAEGDTLDQDRVLGAYLNQDPSHPRLRSTVGWKSGGTPLTGIVANGTAGTITLNRVTRERWGKKETEACAVNTLAHELSHTVALHPGTDNAFLFTDRGLRVANEKHRALASYVIGAVAECVYPKHDVDSATLARCIRDLKADESKPTPCVPRPRQ